jgi:hypothetical protein
MYNWIWRRLPFGLPGKVAGSLALALATVALLWYVVFPWAEPLMPFDDVQVTETGGNPGVGPDGPDANPAASDEPAIGEHDIPYPTGSNNPAPSPTASR